MSEPQHPTPFGSRTGNPSGREPEGEALAGQAASSGNQAGSLESIVAVGARLAQLRTAKGWSIDDVSARLKVSPQKVRSLEAGDLSHLPDRTFAAGIVRSYAKMLGADPAPFTQALRRVNGPVEQNLSLPAAAGGGLPRARVSVPLNGTGRRRSWLWGVAAVIVAVIALAMWHTGGDSAAWLARLKASANGTSLSGSNGNSATSAASTVATPDELAAANTGEASSAEPGAAGTQPMPHPLGTNALPNSSSTIAAVQGASGAALAPAAPAVAPPAPAATDASASAPAVAGTGTNALELKVKQDSWLSVRQKDGKEVFSGLVHGGNAQRVEGEAPFKVTIGNRAGMDSLTFNDEPVDPAKYAAAKGNVARFSVP